MMIASFNPLHTPNTTFIPKGGHKQIAKIKAEELTLIGLERLK